MRVVPRMFPSIATSSYLSSQPTSPLPGNHERSSSNSTCQAPGPSVLFLELHSDNKHSRGGELSEQPKVFPPFQPGNIKLLTVVDHRASLSSNKDCSRLVWLRAVGALKFSFTVWLEVNLPTELDNSRRVRRRELTEATVTQTVIRVLELGVVEGVESLQPQLQPARLSEGKGLKERDVPVVSARSAQGVVAKSAPIACSRI